MNDENVLENVLEREFIGVLVCLLEDFGISEAIGSLFVVVLSGGNGATGIEERPG